MREDPRRIRIRPRLLTLVLAALFGSQAGAVAGESYAERVANHRRMQKLMNPMNVPVANVLNDAWDPYPQFADPNNRPAPRKGPRVFSIKSSRDGQGQLTYPFGKK